MKVITAITVYNANEAIEFYKCVFSAEVLGDIIMLDSTPGYQETKYEGLVVHSALRIGETTLFINDQVDDYIQKQGRHIQLNVFFDSFEKLTDVFRKLSKDGEIEREIEEEHWGATSGSIKDKYGVVWHLYQTH